MATRLFDEVVQLINIAGTEQKVYEPPAGEVAIIQKLQAINTDTSANCIVHAWIDQDGGSAVAQGDASQFLRTEPLSALETKPLPAAGRKIAPGGQLYFDVSTPAGGNFQSAVNIHVSGVLVTQVRAATGTGV